MNNNIQEGLRWLDQGEAGLKTLFAGLKGNKPVQLVVEIYQISLLGANGS